MSKSEATIQSEILVEANKRGHRLWRSNAGKIKTQQNTFIQLFPKGFPDLVGFRKSDGKFIVIEVKNTKGKLRPEQVKFAEFAGNQPILYGVARSVDDAIKIIEEENNMITVFSKPNCMQCEFSKKYLKDKGVEFKEIDVFEDDESLAMLRDAGYAQMPVIDINGEKHTGFRPDILAKVVK